MNIYVNIPDVRGSATDVNHKGQVPAMAYSFSKSRSVRMQVGYTSNRESGAPSFSYFELVKPIDISSPQIYQLFATGKCLEKVIVQVCHTGRGGQVYHEFTLYNVMVADRSLGNVSDKLHTGLEYLTLSYTRLDEKFIPYDGQNKIGSPIITGYDLETRCRVNQSSKSVFFIANSSANLKIARPRLIIGPEAIHPILA